MNKKIHFIGWMQMIFSVLLAASFIWAYVTFRYSAGEFMSSMSNSILSASTVLTKIAETIKTRQLLVDDMTRTLRATRKLVFELQASAQTQGKLIPQYSDNLKYAATLSANLASGISNVGDGIMFSVPTKVSMEGAKPILIWTRPLAQQGLELKAHGKQIKRLSDSLVSFSVMMNQDAQRLNSTFIATCSETIRLLDDVGKSVTVLNRQDLPAAIADLEKASESLKEASNRIHLTQNFSLALLVAGLILSAWCFIHSVGVIMIAKSLAAPPYDLLIKS